MAVMRRILGAYAMLTAAAVGAHFVVTPLYDDGSTGFPVWKVFDWFMAPGALLALATGAIGKFRLDRGEGGALDAGRAFEVNAFFYASAVLALWFFWNWFGDLMARGDAAMWAFIDPLFVLVVGACGFRLWRGEARFSGHDTTTTVSDDDPRHPLPSVASLSGGDVSFPGGEDEQDAGERGQSA